MAYFAPLHSHFNSRQYMFLSQGWAHRDKRGRQALRTGASLLLGTTSSYQLVDEHTEYVVPHALWQMSHISDPS